VAIVAFVLALLAFVLEVLDVSVLGQAGVDLVSAGLAFLALGFLIGSLPRTPRG
jgi:ABC-type transport system involved in multi-copper enzyme maturation permease subunit